MSKQENRREIVGEERRGWREEVRKKNDSKRGAEKKRKRRNMKMTLLRKVRNKDRRGGHLEGLTAAEEVEQGTGRQENKV
jgi:hypothetical protein